MPIFYKCVWKSKSPLEREDPGSSLQYFMGGFGRLAEFDPDFEMGLSRGPEGVEPAESGLAELHAHRSHARHI